MTSDATITNLGLQNVNISDINTNSEVGGLIGDENENTGGSAISDCWVSGTVIGNAVVGGLIGDYDTDGIISDCYSTATVTGNATSRYMGGLIGSVRYGSLSNCFASGPVTGNKYVGGLVGGGEDLNLSYCYATGNVSGIGPNYEYEGGLLGYGTSDYTNTIQYCYATGTVTGIGSGSEVGGLIGSISSTGNPYTVTYCDATGNVAGGNPENGNGDTGGLIGSSSYCAITYCYYAPSDEEGGVVGGDPSGHHTSTGGLIGSSANDAEIEHCWTSGSVMTGYQIGGLIGQCHQ
jgi:hypothetical protein